MGLDIRVATDVDNGSKVVAESRYNSFSRTFCNIMLRYYGVSVNSEIGQIGKLANIDIYPLVEMNEYPYGDGFDFSVIEDEDERQMTISNAQSIMMKLTGNIGKVIDTVNKMISEVPQIENLSKLLVVNESEVGMYSVYFADFFEDKGDGYIGNNFGQDLRNLKQFLELVKNYGAKTVWFDYG